MIETAPPRFSRCTMRRSQVLFESAGASTAGVFQLGGSSSAIHIPPPAYPPGAALFEQQRAAGIGLLQPTGTDNEPLLAASTAHRVWPAGTLLAAALHDGTINCKGLNVLELGAGCGLPGLSAWRAGAAVCCLTDLGENLPRLREIVAQNGAPSIVRVETLDWTKALPDSIATTRWDLLIGADCVFWPSLFDPLLTVLEALVQHSGPRIILSTVDRLGRGVEFDERARARGWEVSELPTPTSSLRVESDGAAQEPPPRLIEMKRAVG